MIEDLDGVPIQQTTLINYSDFNLASLSFNDRKGLQTMLQSLKVVENYFEEFVPRCSEYLDCLKNGNFKDRKMPNWNIEIVNHCQSEFKCKKCGIAFNDARKLGGHVSKTHPSSVKIRKLKSETNLMNEKKRIMKKTMEFEESEENRIKKQKKKSNLFNKKEKK